MPIWFVYRSPYDGPMSKHVQRLDGPDTLLAWFRSIWQAIPDDEQARAHAENLFGTYVYGCTSLFCEMAIESVAPDTMDDLHDTLQAALYAEEYLRNDDTIQASTRDDRSAVAYWFTDTFARQHPQRVAYLLRDDWRLPDTVGTGRFLPKPGLRLLTPTGRRRTTKAIYLVTHDLSRCGDIDDLCPAEKLPHLRLPDLVPWLLTQSADAIEPLSGHQLAHIRTALLQVLAEGDGLEAGFRRTLAESPTDQVTWNAYTDWLLDHARPPASQTLLDLSLRRLSLEAEENWSGQPLIERAQTGAHAASLIRPSHRDLYDQWYLFDDQWACANKDLANALLDYQGRFNVLDDWDAETAYGPEIPAGEEREG